MQEFILFCCAFGLFILFSRQNRIARKVDDLRKEIGRLNASLQSLRLKNKDASPPPSDVTRDEEVEASTSVLEELARQKRKSSTKPPAPFTGERTVEPSKTEELEKASKAVSSEEHVFPPQESDEPEDTSPVPVSEEQAALHPAGPTIGERATTLMKKLGPDDPDMGWEMQLGTYWLPRAGVLALGVMIVFLLTLALNTWGALFRVGIGYGVCALLFAIGWRLERKYPRYTRVLYGGGFGLVYIVTFATYYVPFAQIFDTPTLTLLALAAIVGAWVALAQYRKSPVIAMLATCLGHFTIGLTTFSVDNPTRSSMLGIVLLSLGSAFFLLRNRWYYVAAVGIAGSYLNQFLLLTRSESSGTPLEFAMAMGVSSLFLLMFAAAEFFAPEETRRERIPLWFRTTLMTFNTVAFFLLGTVLMGGFEFSADYQYLFRYTLAGVLLVFSLGYLHKRHADPLFNLYLTKAATVVTFGLANQFDGESLTVSLAIETVVLLISSKRSGLPITRGLAHIVGLVTFFHALMTATELTPILYDSPGHIALSVQVLFIVLAFFIASDFYLRSNWRASSVVWTPRNTSLRFVLWNFDFVDELPEEFEKQEKPLGGQLFPYLYAAAGFIILALYTHAIIEYEDRAMASAIFAMAISLVAIFRHSAPFGRGGLGLTVIAWIWSIAFFAHSQPASYSDENYATLFSKFFGSTLLLITLTEIIRRRTERESDEKRSIFGNLKLSVSRKLDAQSAMSVLAAPCLIGATAAFLYLTLTYGLIAEGHRALAIFAAAAALSLLAKGLNALPFGLAAIIWTVAGLAVGTVEQLDTMTPMVSVCMLIALATIGVCSEARYFRTPEGLYFHQTPASPYFLYGSLGWLTGLFIIDYFNVISVPMALLTACIVAAGLSLALHGLAWSFVSVGLFIWAQLYWHGDVPFQDDNFYVALTLSLIALSFAGDRFFEWQKRRLFGPVMLVTAWFVFGRFLYIEIAEAWLATVASFVAAGYLAYGLILRSRTSIVLALLTGLLATLQHAVLTVSETLELTPMLAGFLAPVALWILCERLATTASKRFNVAVPEAVPITLVVISTTLLLRMLSLVPAFSEYYLTISWCVLAVALFGVSLAFREKFYRYAGLAVILLSSLRIVAIDTRNLDTVPRIIAWGVLGVVILALSFGYVKAWSTRTKDSSS